jgi:hypothetical protein
MKFAAALTLAALVATPVSAQSPCITGPEAEAMTLVALPDIIRETGRVCAARLPATSLVRNQSSTLIARYQIEAELSDPAVDALLQSDYARPLLTSLLVPQIVGRIAARDCGTIDRLVTLLQPLPPRNTAGIVVETLRYLKADKARRGDRSTPDLPLCTATESR